MDPATEKILLIGEGGTTLEEKAADYIADHITKPIIGYIPGRRIALEKDKFNLKNENELEARFS